MIICITARMGSSRLPGKVLADICGKPMLLRLIERLSDVTVPIVVCTTTLSADQAIVELCVTQGVSWSRGPEADVMQRLISAARYQQAGDIVRVTGDNPLTDPSMIKALVAAHEKNKNYYTYTTGQPSGTRAEVINVAALEVLHDRVSGDLRENMTPALMTMPNTQRVEFGNYAPDIRLTVDYQEDLERVRQIYGVFGDKIPPLSELIDWCRSNL